MKLECESDPTLYRPLPRTRITGGQWPNAPDASRGKILPLVFGDNLQALEGIPVDDALDPAGATTYVFCESPAATPVTIGNIQIIDTNPLSGLDELVTLASASNPFQSQTAGTVAFLVSELGYEAAWGLYDGAVSRLLSTVELELSRAGAGLLLTGYLVLTIEENAGGIPSGTPFVPHAVANLNANAVTDDITYRYYTLVMTLPVLLRAGTIYWIVLRYKAGSTTETTSLRMRQFLNIDAPGGAGLLLGPPYRGTEGWSAYNANPTRTLPNYKVNGFAYTASVAMTDSQGLKVAGVTFSAPLVEGARVSGLIYGMLDDGSGTYTGVPNLRIGAGSDILRWLMRAARGFGLATDRVDAASLTVARERLSDWSALGGVLFEEQDGRIWLSRVARDAKCVVYENQDGQLAVYADRGNAPMKLPVRLVRPWEHGPLTMSNSAQGTPAAEALPWTRVEVFGGRDLVGIERFRNVGIPVLPGTRPTTEWDEYVVIAADHTDPADAVRQAQAVALTTRYGVRANSGATQEGVLPGAVEGSAGYFTPDKARVTSLRNYLWDNGAIRPQPFNLVEGMFPRFAFGWRLMDEVDLESYEFPSGSERALPGEVHIIGAVVDGGTTKAYMARRGRFSVRGHAPLAAHGTDDPVHATLRLREWLTA